MLSYYNPAKYPYPYPDSVNAESGCEHENITSIAEPEIFGSTLETVSNSEILSKEDQEIDDLINYLYKENILFGFKA